MVHLKQFLMKYAYNYYIYSCYNKSYICCFSFTASKNILKFTNLNRSRLDRPMFVLGPPLERVAALYGRAADGRAGHGYLRHSCHRLQLSRARDLR